MPGLALAPIAANAAAPSRMIHGTAARVWTLLTTVGLPNRPRCGRVRRPLLGLAALALERLEQDRLLAQHVRALHGPDGHLDPVARAEDVLAQEARLLRPEDRALEQRDERRVLGADGDDRLGRADGERGDREALDEAPRVGGDERRVGAHRRVRAVAVGHDVALGRRLVRGGAPLLAGREAAAARGRAGRTTRRSRWCRSARGRGRPCAARRTRRRGSPRRGRTGLPRAPPRVP